MQVLSLSLEDNLKPKYMYLINELRNEVHSLTKYPTYLSLSLDQRIRPRHRFLVFLKKAPKGPFPLSSLVRTDECFCQQWAGTSLDTYLDFRQSLLLKEFAKKCGRWWWRQNLMIIQYEKNRKAVLPQLWTKSSIHLFLLEGWVLEPRLQIQGTKVLLSQSNCQITRSIQDQECSHSLMYWWPTWFTVTCLVCVHTLVKFQLDHAAGITCYYFLTWRWHDWRWPLRWTLMQKLWVSWLLGCYLFTLLTTARIWYTLSWHFITSDYWKSRTESWKSLHFQG